MVHADVASANIVGYYADSTVKEAGYRILTPMFNPIGGGTFNISNIVPVAVGGNVVPDGSTSSSRMTVVKFGKDGYDDPDAPKLSWRADKSPAGWYVGSTSRREFWEVKPGEGVWLKIPDGYNGVTLQFAGEVPTKEIYADMNAGYTMSGNPMPVTLNISNIVPVAKATYEVPDGSASSSRMTVVKFGKDGYDDPDAPKLSWRADKSPAGWYVGSTSRREFWDIAPGEGIWVKVPDGYEGVQLKFPAPKLSE